MTFPPPSRVPLDAQALLYLLLVTVVMPIGAVLSQPLIGRGRGDVHGPARTRVLSQAVIIQIVLFVASLFVARTHRILLWPSPHLGRRELTVGIAAFLVLLGVGVVSWRMRSAEERRTMWVRHLLPSTRAQWALWLVVSLAAGISEETTYRGVLVVLLGSFTASMMIGAFLSAVVFAVLHYPQGGKSMALVFAIALVMQVVVSATGALYVAMGVHAAYDITAGVRAARRFAEEF